MESAPEETPLISVSAETEDSPGPVDPPPVTNVPPTDELPNVIWIKHGDAVVPVDTTGCVTVGDLSRKIMDDPGYRSALGLDPTLKGMLLR